MPWVLYKSLQIWGIRRKVKFGEFIFSTSGGKFVGGFVQQKHLNVQTIKVQLRKAAVTLNFSGAGEGWGRKLEGERGIFLSERGIKFKTEFSGIEYAANNKCENKFQSNTIFRETAAH